MDGQLLAFGATLALLVLLVLLPIGLTALNSFQAGRAGQFSGLDLEGWRTALKEPGIQTSILNTIALLLTRTMISFPIAVVFAWLLARTDLPGRGALEFMF